ncbi:MAG: hypothetical protein CM1200mP9_04430 [Gammaproteobacteria bacterium]|nr:MAG: hypothetical protein CM1200mP9_04430 [Gammaproteobacteria bacterium]
MRRGGWWFGGGPLSSRKKDAFPSSSNKIFVRTERSRTVCHAGTRSSAQKNTRKLTKTLLLPGWCSFRALDLAWTFPFFTLSNNAGLSAFILAHGAWLDRPLPIEGADRFIGNGLSYQNPFVYWFNHYEESGFSGEDFPIHDDAIVIGGGLASIDVCKILNLELYTRALRDRGITADVEEMELRGIPEQSRPTGIAGRFCDTRLHAFLSSWQRRMPLENISNPTAQRMEKLRGTRAKIMDKVCGST